MTTTVLNLDLQRRRPDGTRRMDPLTIETDRIGAMLVDTWNYHWCMTASERCASFAGRMNHALNTLRALDVQVFWGPTDVADHYAGTRQRERAVSVRRHALPEPIEVQTPELDCYRSGHCMCGPGIDCQVNYGWDAMNPDLQMKSNDLIVDGTEEVYSWCRELGITHLLYLGFHTNMCTTGKPVGIVPMMKTGIHPILARDMTDAISGYEPSDHEHPDQGTFDVVEHLERLIPTIHLESEIRKTGRWEKGRGADPVRITPWGRPARPYQFEDTVAVALSAPFHEGHELYFTTDTSEPTPWSMLYRDRILITRTCTIRAVAFRGAVPVGRESHAYFVRLPAKPPHPDVPLSELTPKRTTVAGYNDYGSTKRPKINEAYTGAPLRLRTVTYRSGIGVEAPSQLLYAIDPSHIRFVALAGVDESMLDDELGRERAMHPAVIFRLFIDGLLIQESPIMRISQEPWRFDTSIASGSRTISLTAAPAHEQSRYNYANWVNAGFVRRQ